MIKEKQKVIERLQDALRKYEHLCKNEAPGKKGIKREKTLHCIISRIENGNLTELCQFYLRERSSGWFEPRLTQCLRDALYKIFDIKRPSYTPYQGGSLFGRSLEQFEKFKRMEDELHEKINAYVDSNSIADRSDSIELRPITGQS